MKLKPFQQLAATLILAPIFFASPAAAAPKALVDYINPVIGSSTQRELGEGKTFPGPTTPFGLVQLSPDTITGGDNGSGYSWEHKSIEGFSLTHMSGVGAGGDLGNFLIMPTTGKLKTERGINGAEDGYRSRFRNETEVVRTGYYAVTLDDYKIRAELTAAPRAGMLRFTFPKSEQSRIQIDLARRVAGTSTKQFVKVVDEHTIEGWMECTSAGGGWLNGNTKDFSYTVYFSAHFNHPLNKFGVWSAKIPDEWKRFGISYRPVKDPATANHKDPNDRVIVESQEFRDAVAHAEILDGCRELEGKHLGFFEEFPTMEGEQVLLKVGISFVSVEGARANLLHDIPDWDFERVQKQSRELWSQALAGVATEGGTETQKTIFATALYHMMIDPRACSDVDGLYTGADHKIHKTGDYTYRTIFSGWDVFRSEFPLLTIIRPDIVNDEVNSLMQQALLGGKGYLARWEILGCESGCMIGDPAVSVITDAYLKGIRHYDVAQAYELCRTSVAGPKSGRKELNFYLTNGYVPESISWTLENAYFDYCAGRFAAALGKTNDADLLFKRSLNYSNIYDPSVGSMHAKMSDGSWLLWKGATKGGQGCVESNPYQQGWFVPQDVPGLINLMGKDYFLRHLTDFFEKTPTNFLWNDYCNHSDEPVHHTAYLFTYAGAPWLTQKWSRFIMDHAYGTGVNGICGNDDVGQMSAWYVMSAIGFHPVSPVDGVYIIGSPIFDKVSIRLDPRYYQGHEFTVITHNNSAQNIYLQSVQLNGLPLARGWLRHEEVVAGGTLELFMGPAPKKDFGANIQALPPSFRTESK